MPQAPEEIWPFFCDEGNLEELTPAFLNIEVLGKSTCEIGEGTSEVQRMVIARELFR